MRYLFLIFLSGCGMYVPPPTHCEIRYVITNQDEYHQCVQSDTKCEMKATLSCDKD